jgi:hypothetical protein
MMLNSLCKHFVIPLVMMGLMVITVLILWNSIPAQERASQCTVRKSFEGWVNPQTLRTP